jgi:hypothetical protein
MGAQVGGDGLDLGARVPGGVLSTANLAAKTLVNMDGSVPASAADCTGGVAASDVASGDSVDLKIPPGIYAIVAGGAVTAGLEVEILQLSVYGNINGVKTAITAAGVVNIASGYVIGRALTSGVLYDTVLVNVSVSPSK